jgi:diamine N-acetyltransferase
MITLKGEKTYTSAFEPNDLEFIYAMKTNRDVGSGVILIPLQSVLVKQYLENAHQDIYEAKQLIGDLPGSDFPAVGLIDLFDFDPKKQGRSRNCNTGT